MILRLVEAVGIGIKTNHRDASTEIRTTMMSHLGVKTQCVIMRAKMSGDDRRRRSTMTIVTKHRRHEVVATETETVMIEGTALTTTDEGHVMTTIAATRLTDATNAAAAIEIETETGIETGTATDATNLEIGTEIETETTTDETATEIEGRAGVLLAAVREVLTSIR